MSDSDEAGHLENPHASSMPSAAAIDQQVPSGCCQSLADTQHDREIEVLEDRLKRGERWIIALTAAMTIATFSSAYVANKQWQVMMRQANVMQDQLGAMNSATHVEQRAWILFKDAGVFSATGSDPDALTVTVIRLDIANTGRTPAVVMTDRFRVDFGDGAVTEAHISVGNGESINEGIGAASVGAGETVHATLFLSYFYSAKLLDELRQGQAVIRVTGDVSYKDMFGVSHRTWCCYRSVRNTQYPTSRRIIFFACTNNNNGD